MCYCLLKALLLRLLLLLLLPLLLLSIIIKIMFVLSFLYKPITDRTVIFKKPISLIHFGW